MFFQQLAKLKKKIEDLEKERLANIPLDTSKEIKNLQNQIVSAYPVAKLLKVTCWVEVFPYNYEMTLVIAAYNAFSRK